MKITVLAIFVSVLSGCANMEWVTTSSRYGYKPYDPCIRCGEKWDQLPNEPFEAQRRKARGETW
jgi:hypothetical protein